MSTRIPCQTPFRARGRLAPILLGCFLLAGCASFSADGGLGVVADVIDATIQKDVVSVTTPGEARTALDRVRQLLRHPLTVEAAVQIALLNNKGLQASYNELALAEAELVQNSLPPNPTFSISRISGDGALEIERRVIGDILALATLPFRSEIARERFQRAPLIAADDTLRLAAEVRRSYFRAVAANQLAALLNEANATAKSTAQLAAKLGQTGSLNKLDQAREQVFYAETTADLAALRQDAASTREQLTRLLGLWGDDLNFKLPQKLPVLPGRPQSLPHIEIDAVVHRLDLQIARMELDALAKSLNLTQASRFVTLLDVAGIDRKTRDPDTPPFREHGFDIQFQVPLFDGGEVRVRQAIDTYNQAFNRLTEKAVNVRSEARDAFQVYRSTYDIANHYQREVLPLRQIISEEMQLRFSSMQVDVFALVTEGRQRLGALRNAVAEKRAFWLAQSELQTAIDGGGETPRGTSRSATTAQASGGAH